MIWFNWKEQRAKCGNSYHKKDSKQTHALCLMVHHPRKIRLIPVKFATWLGRCTSDMARTKYSHVDTIWQHANTHTHKLINQLYWVPRRVSGNNGLLLLTLSLSLFFLFPLLWIQFSFQDLSPLSFSLAFLLLSLYCLSLSFFLFFHLDSPFQHVELYFSTGSLFGFSGFCPCGALSG